MPELVLPSEGPNTKKLLDIARTFVQLRAFSGQAGQILFAILPARFVYIVEPDNGGMMSPVCRFCAIAGGGEPTAVVLEDPPKNWGRP